ncbi:MAG: 1,4-dihydroxy-6-naphthoate synthase [Chitinophagaceae bacterium]|nr:1,4-dihydroxy-6-naphthoate synthase [Chitinophagaceae bacterium]
MTLTLGFSPCPNDTFIFDALVNKKINSEELNFDVTLEDVETLNRLAYEQKLDITKLSFPALFDNADKYVILNTGAAFGKGVGPLLISKKNISLPEVQNCTIAIPGTNTTANFLLQHAFPAATKKIEIIFSEIEDAVIDDKAEIGLIIHESRFTYEQKGLKKIIDLGEFWHQQTQLPVPLGCIAAKESLSVPIKKKVDELIKRSLEYAFENSPIIPGYVKDHAREMNEQVIHKHIELYVNEFSLNIGKKGKEAIKKLYSIYCSIKARNIHSSSDMFFL